MLLSENNPYYQFNLLKKVNTPEYYKNKITTLFIIKGHIDIKLDNAEINIKENEGIVLSQNTKIEAISNSINSEILEVVSNKKNEILVEKIDDGKSVIESQINDYKILKNRREVKLSI